MKHAIMFKGVEIKFSINDCKKCEEAMAVMMHNTNCKTCIECVDRSKLGSRTKSYPDVKFFKGKKNKSFISDWKNGVYEKVRFERCRKKYGFRKDYEIII